MRAEKVTVETDSTGQLIGLPALPPHTRIEVILLFPAPSTFTGRKRMPPAELAGKMTYSNDLLIPISPSDEWESAR